MKKQKFSSLEEAEKFAIETVKELFSWNDTEPEILGAGSSPKNYQISLMIKSYNFYIRSADMELVNRISYVSSCARKKFIFHFVLGKENIDKNSTKTKNS
ncbi:MAG: hypothetical protein KGY74_10785 [Candidatus Cloacimonetes bacterium]|nr:hypothetical protein [Candidatus Cloacimonadota bacterium]